MKELSSRMQSKRETERHISGASTNLNCYIQSQMAELIMQSNLYYIYPIVVFRLQTQCS